MCDNCKDVILTEYFYSPRDYMDCLAYIKTLLETEKFELIKATCPIDCVRRKNGGWYGDIIMHQIQCKKCQKVFTCFCDTYHGNGSFQP